MYSGIMKARRKKMDGEEYMNRGRQRKRQRLVYSSSPSSSPSEFIRVHQSHTTLVTHAGFNRWAALNAAVILYPQLKNIETSCWSSEGCGVGESKQQSWGCWDSYGYGGPDYDLQDGAQIRALIAMVDHLTHPVAQDALV